MEVEEGEVSWTDHHCPQQKTATIRDESSMSSRTTSCGTRRRQATFLGSPRDRKLLRKIFEDVDLFESASALLMLRDGSRA